MAKKSERTGYQVGIWIRVSTEDQAKGESPEHHERRARFYAESKGWEVIEVYHLEGVSGKSVMEHPEAKRMLSDVKRGKISCLIFSKLARLARNTRELLDFADLFREAGADLVSLQESIDTSTPAGRLFYTMIAAMAQWEREEIASRVAASVSVRAKMGKSLGGQAPFGYRFEDKQLVPDPNEAPVRKLMYELFLTHRRKKKVARLLNEQGHRTRKGAEFSDTTVDRLLRDPTAKGKHRLNYTSSVDSRKAWKLKPESEWEYADVPPIVSEEVWNRANSILEEARAKLKKPTKPTVHLFAGLTFCECGGKMYVLSGSPKYVCQKCRNKLAADDLEAVYLAQLADFFTSAPALRSKLEEGRAALVEKEQLLTVKRRDLEKTKGEIDRVYRLYVDERLTAEQFSEFFEPLEARKKALEVEIPQAEAEIDRERIDSLSVGEVISEAESLKAQWPSLSKEGRRAVVESITQRITVGVGIETNVEIELSYIPSGEELTKRQRNFRGSWRSPA